MARRVWLDRKIQIAEEAILLRNDISGKVRAAMLLELTGEFWSTGQVAGARLRAREAFGHVAVKREKPPPKPVKTGAKKNRLWTYDYVPPSEKAKPYRPKKPPEPSRRISVVDATAALRRHQCRYPFFTDQYPDYGYCCLPVERGPYCEVHARRCEKKVLKDGTSPQAA